MDMNFGGIKRFIFGPYKQEYGFGTYGIDPYSKTVWAVVNYNSDFVVTTGINLPSFYDIFIEWYLNLICGNNPISSPISDYALFNNFGFDDPVIPTQVH